MTYLLPFLAAFLLTLVGTRAAIRVLPRLGFHDRREAHHDHVLRPRGGGIVLVLVFATLFLMFLPVEKPLIGLLVGLALVVAPNLVDDRTNRVPWWVRLGFEALGALALVVSGVGASAIANPFTGEAILLDQWRIPVEFFGLTGTLYVWEDLFTLVWVLLAINAMNWLDGVDGLATGVSGISALTLFGLSLLPFVNQPSVATMAIIVAGGCAAFLVYNFQPAKMCLGDTGSTALGFLLAVLSIYSSGKVATFFLVFGLPLLDVAWVIFRRVVLEKKSPFAGDRRHLHHRLQNLGLSVPKTVLVFYGFSATFGLIALFLQGAQQKLIAILAMMATMVLLATYVVLKSRRVRTGQKVESRE